MQKNNARDLGYSEDARVISSSCIYDFCGNNFEDNQLKECIVKFCLNPILDKDLTNLNLMNDRLFKNKIKEILLENHNKGAYNPNDFNIMNDILLSKQKKSAVIDSQKSWSDNKEIDDKIKKIRRVFSVTKKYYHLGLGYHDFYNKTLNFKFGSGYRRCNVNLLNLGLQVERKIYNDFIWGMRSMLGVGASFFRYNKGRNTVTSYALDASLGILYPLKENVYIESVVSAGLSYSVDSLSIKSENGFSLNSKTFFST